MSSPLQIARQEYAVTKGCFEKMLACAEMIDSRMAECRQSNQVVKVGATLFTKYLLHCRALVAVLPALKGQTYYNILSGAVLARALSETFIAFRYQSAETMDPEETAFRYALMNYHYRYKRRAFMSQAMQSNETKLADQRLKEARVALEAVGQFQSQPEKKREWQFQGKESMTRSHEEVAVAAGIQEHFWRSTYVFLSQFAHASPMAVAHFGSVGGDHPVAAKNMSLFATIAGGLLSLMMIDLKRLVPDCLDKLSEDQWDAVEVEANRIKHTVYTVSEAG